MAEGSGECADEGVGREIYSFGLEFSPSSRLAWAFAIENKTITRNYTMGHFTRKKLIVGDVSVSFNVLTYSPFDSSFFKILGSEWEGGSHSYI